VSDSIHVQAIAVANGAHAVSQEQLLAESRRQLGRLPGSEDSLQILNFIYERSEIKERFFELRPDTIASRKDWYRAANQAALSLGLRVIEDLVSQGVRPSECDGLIVASSTHAGFPGFSRQLQSRLGFPLEARCLDLAGMGCAAGPQALFLAARLIESGDCEQVCVLSADALGTFGQLRNYTSLPSHSEMVARGITSDGAAALVLGRRPGEAPLFSFERCSLTTRLLPDSLDMNVLSASEENEPFISVGKDIRTKIPAEFFTMIDADARREPLFFHPGGPALLHALLARAPELGETIGLALEDLRAHGNVGSASVLFVLKSALTRTTITPRFRLVAFGPGKVTAALLVDGVTLPTRARDAAGS